MKLYKILDIREADYGCEECPKDGPHAILILDDGKRIEVSEKWIADNGIKEGKLLHIKEDGSIIKAIRVVAAVIKAEFDSDTNIFATQRGYGELKGGWEFPGGKIEEGETPELALKREIMEELDTEIEVRELIDTIEYDYPTFHLSMQCFWAEVVSGHLELKEAEDARWLTAETIDSVEWLPADRALLDKIKKSLSD